MDLLFSFIHKNSFLIHISSSFLKCVTLKCVNLWYIYYCRKKKASRVGKEIIFIWLCRKESKRLSSSEQLCGNLPQCQNIYYSKAQTQTVKCPTVFEEMKWKLMSNREEVLSLHSYTFIAVWHFNAVTPQQQEETPTESNVINSQLRGVSQEEETLILTTPSCSDPECWHRDLHFTNGFSLRSSRRIKLQQPKLKYYSTTLSFTTSPSNSEVFKSHWVKIQTHYGTDKLNK